MSTHDYYSGFSGFSGLFHHKAISYWDNGYRTLMPSNGKAAFIKNWQLRGEQPICLDDLHIACDHYQEHNLSLVYGPACPIICIDIDSPEYAEEIESLAFEALGATPLISIGNYPKRKLVYQKLHGQKVLSRRFRPVVDLFGHNGQTVLEGIHPNTKRPYTWDSESPATVPVEQLPVATDGALEIFQRALVNWMREKNIIDIARPGAFGRDAAFGTGFLTDDLAKMRMERASCKTPQEFTACVTRHLKAMDPALGNRHGIMTVTVAAMVRRGWTDEHIMHVLQTHYIDRFGDHFSARTNKVVKAITSAREKAQRWQPQYHH